MKAHSHSDGHNPVDAYLRQELKKCAAQHKPPDNARARLLLQASLPADRRKTRVAKVMGSDASVKAFSRSLSKHASDPLNQITLWSLHTTFAPLRHLL